jgi:phage terminase small subunit
LSDKKLEIKHQAFVDQYLICMNQTKAYLKVYPDCSKESARTMASVLMGKPEIKDAISKLRQERSERCKIEADDVLKELALLGFSDMEDYVDYGPVGVTLKEMSELAPDMSRAISEVSHNFTSEGGGSVKFKLHDKRAALVDIGKHLGMFVEKVEHTGKDGAAVKHVWEIVDAPKRKNDPKNPIPEEDK